MAKPTVEDHVRAYLAYLTDPGSLVNPETVAKAQAKADRAKDPIVKAKALSDLDRAQHPDGTELEAAFVECVADWAATEQVTVRALRSLRVPADVLARAGMAVSANGDRSPGKKTPAAKPRLRQPPISLDTVAEQAPHTDFSTEDLAAAIDRSTATTRNYVTRLLTEGVIVEVGPDPGHQGKGKPPILYRRA